MTKCLGCGALLQTTNENEIGYTKDLNNSLCIRCFRIKNYNDYKIVIKDNSDYINILKNINKTDDLVLLVVDIFDIPKNLSDIRKYLDNDILLVITKRDILPKSVYDNNLVDYFNKYDLNIKDVVIVSSKNNYNFDKLFEMINYYKKGKNVYIIGYTNAGKSSLINKLMYHYGESESEVTVSSMPSTTIDTIYLELNDSLTLIDTPGLINDGSITNCINGDLLKRIVPKKEIKPIVYQIKGTQYLMIDDLLKMDVSDNNIVLYFANDLDIKRYYHDVDYKYLKKYSFNVLKDNDIVISGLGFIKCSNSGIIDVYVNKNIDVYLRDSLI